MRNILLFSAFFMAFLVNAQQNIQLPKPDMNVNMSLVDALAQRHSSRTFSKRAIELPVLSQILWAACGINREDEHKITAPSAINAQDIKVYVCCEKGVYEYVPTTHSLLLRCEKDLRQSVAGFQQFASEAPISLILVSDHNKFGDRKQGASRMGAIDSGYVSENISLICTALGINTVPRMTMDSAVIKAELQLDDSFDVLINHPIGYPQE